MRLFDAAAAAKVDAVVVVVVVDATNVMSHAIWFTKMRQATDRQI